MFPYQEKMSNLDISTRQNWTSPIENLQEKGNNDPLNKCYCRLQGNEIMVHESLPKSWLTPQCACPDGMSRNYNL